MNSNFVVESSCLGRVQVVLCYNPTARWLPLYLDSTSDMKPAGICIGARMLQRRHINKQRILERDLYICAYCLGNASEVEHVVPWAWTHNNDDDNLVASCHECNQIAGGRIFSSFDEKRAYIQILRNGKKWTRKLAIKYQVFRCSDCKVVFEPLMDGATNFLCPSCTKKEYADLEAT